MQVISGDIDPADESDDALFARAIAAHLLAGDDEDTYSDAVDVLFRRGTEAIRARAIELLADARPGGRCVGAAVLAGIDGAAGRPADPATVEAVLAALDGEGDPVVVQAEVEALGDLLDPRAISAVLAHAGDPTPFVRRTVARSLTNLVAQGDGPVDEADPPVAAVLALMADPDSEVRDWATFGIGTQLPVDGPATRDALWRRLDDPDEDARAEGLHGLAIRHDPRAVALVRAELEAESVGRLAVESASVLGDPSLLPALRDLESWWDVDEPLLAKAIGACDPEVQAFEMSQLTRLFERLEEVEPGLDVTVLCDRFEPDSTQPLLRWWEHGEALPIDVDLRSAFATAESVDEVAEELLSSNRGHL